MSLLTSPYQGTTEGLAEADILHYPNNRCPSWVILSTSSSSEFEGVSPLTGGGMSHGTPFLSLLLLGFSPFKRNQLYKSCQSQVHADNRSIREAEAGGSWVDPEVSLGYIARTCLQKKKTEASCRWTCNRKIASIIPAFEESKLMGVKYSSSILGQGHFRLSDCQVLNAVFITFESVSSK